jgi:hypothetical protein
MPGWWGAAVDEVGIASPGRQLIRYRLSYASCLPEPGRSDILAGMMPAGIDAIGADDRPLGPNLGMDRRALEAAARVQTGLATLLLSARSSEKDLFCCYAYRDRAAARGCPAEGVPPVVKMGDSPGHFHAAPGWYPVSCSRINGGTINAVRRHPAARMQRDGGPSMIGPMRPDPWAGPGGRGPRPLD